MWLQTISPQFSQSVSPFQFDSFKKSEVNLGTVLLRGTDVTYEELQEHTATVAEPLLADGEPGALTLS